MCVHVQGTSVAILLDNLCYVVNLTIYVHGYNMRLAAYLKELAPSEASLFCTKNPRAGEVWWQHKLCLLVESEHNNCDDTACNNSFC